jgi:GMP synthase-like glutamine amidotransferase
MSILFIQHVANEGPGIFKQVLDAYAIPFHTLETFLPVSFVLPGDCRGVIILGGPMNVDEESDYPFLAEEKTFIRELVRKDIPLLGICLGAQLIAQAAGGKVYKADEKEFGWYEVHLTREGSQDFLFGGLPESFHVFQWHEDTFTIPLQGKSLVTAAGCPNQGFKVGKRAYGIQFHLEADATMINGWLSSERDAGHVSSLEIIRQETSEKSTDCVRWGKKLLANFLAVAQESSNLSVDSGSEKW